MPYIRNHSMERWTHTAWTPPSLPNSIVLLGGTVGSGDAAFTAEIVPGDDNQGFLYWPIDKKGLQSQDSFLPDGGTFALEHSGESACGIPDKDTIVMTGGWEHNYVTR